MQNHYRDVHGLNIIITDTLNEKTDDEKSDIEIQVEAGGNKVMEKLYREVMKIL